MANVTPIKLNGNFHSPFVAGDTIDSALLKIVSADAGNDITAGSDGGAYFNFTPQTVVSADANNDLTSGTDGGAFLDLDSAAVTEKIQDAIGVALTSPLTYNDVLNTISTSVSGVTVVSSDSGNDLTAGVDGGAFLDLGGAASVEKIQDAVGSILQSPLVYNDASNTISISIPSTTVVSSDTGNDLTSGTDGGAFLDLDSAAVTEKIQDAVGAALTSPLTYNDVLNTIAVSVSGVTVVSADSGNDVTTGTDGGAFFDLDSATSIEKIQDAVGGILQSPLVYNDASNTISISIPSTTVVSADSGNDITAGVDGGAFLDLDSATSIEKIQDAIGSILQAPLVYNDASNTISTTALDTVSVGAGLSGNGTSGSPIVPDFDTLPASSVGNLPVGTKFVVSGTNGELATSAQVGQNVASDVQTNLVKGDIVAGTNVSLTGTATSRLLGTGNLTINVSGAAPTGSADGDLTGTYPNPTIKSNVALTGVPTVPTAILGTDTTQIANTAFVAAAIASLVASSPAALDTLNELAAALGNDANFSATITTALGLKAPLASPALTGVPTVPTATLGTNTTQAASTAFVTAADNALSSTITSSLALKANKDGSGLSGGDVTAWKTSLGLGTAATLNVPASGNASLTEVVKGNDTRITSVATTGKAIAMAIVFGG